MDELDLEELLQADLIICEHDELQKSIKSKLIGTAGNWITVAGRHIFIAAKAAGKKTGSLVTRVIGGKNARIREHLHPGGKNYVVNTPADLDHYFEQVARMKRKTVLDKLKITPEELAMHQKSKKGTIIHSIEEDGLETALSEGNLFAPGGTDGHPTSGQTGSINSPIDYKMDNVKSRHKMMGNCVARKAKAHIKAGMSKSDAVIAATRECAKMQKAMEEAGIEIYTEDEFNKGVLGVALKAGRWITYGGKKIFIAAKGAGGAIKAGVKAAHRFTSKNEITGEVASGVVAGTIAIHQLNKYKKKLEEDKSLTPAQRKKLMEAKGKQLAGRFAHNIAAIEDSIQTSLLHDDELDEFTDTELDNLEKGITLTHQDINTLVEDNPITITSKATYFRYKNPNRVDIELFEKADSSRVASFTFYVDEPKKITAQQLGVIEALTTARLASEILRPIILEATYPISKGLDDLLTKYAGAKVTYLATDINPPVPHVLSTRPVILFSGGADSSSLLASQQGTADALTFSHGQSFTHGQWNERKASQAVFEIVKSLGDTDSKLVYAKHRFRVYKYPKVWAKSFRNLFFAFHGSLLNPDRQLWLGAHFDDIEHDCNAELVDQFRLITGIQLHAPVMFDSRYNIIKRSVDFANELHPYLYGSTFSCQMGRFFGKSHLFCGSCHSCLLRLPGIQFEIDPRFKNFNTAFEVTPEDLPIPIHKAWAKPNFPWPAANRWMARLNDEQQSHFVKSIELVKHLEHSVSVPVSKKELPNKFIIRFVGGMSHKMVKDLVLYKDEGDSVFIPFTGSGRSVYQFAQQGKNVICCDVQPFVSHLMSVLKGEGSTNVNLNTESAEGWITKNRQFRADEDIARYIDGYILTYKDNPVAKAMMGYAITNATFRGYLGSFDVHTVDEFKKLLENAHDRLALYHGSCPNIDFRLSSYEDINPGSVDLMFIDPPKVVSDTDVYSTGYAGLNGVLSQESSKLDAWTSKGYTDRFQHLVNIPCKKWLFCYTTDVNPPLNEMVTYLESQGSTRCVNNYTMSKRCDYLFEVDRTPNGTD